MIIEIHTSKNPQSDQHLMRELSMNLSVLFNLQNAQEVTISTGYGVIKSKKVNLRYITKFYPYDDIENVLEKENVPDHRS